MPLRDHCRPPVDDQVSWESFHGQWPAMIVVDLARRLPKSFQAVPRMHLGSAVEIDIGTYEKIEAAELHAFGHANGEPAVWAAPAPTCTVEADLPSQDEYEVRIYDVKRGRRLVAAIEIVSPANKDRPEHRRAFVAKCAALIQNQVSVSIVDAVTVRQFNLYADLLELTGNHDPELAPVAPSIYAVTCRGSQRNGKVVIDSWFFPMKIGDRLPSLPLWLNDDQSIPLELEATYQETCKTLRVG